MHANTLANLSSTIKIEFKKIILIEFLDSLSRLLEKETMEIIMPNNWITLSIPYVKYKIIPFNKAKEKKLRTKAIKYALLNEIIISVLL